MREHLRQKNVGDVSRGGQGKRHRVGTDKSILAQESPGKAVRPQPTYCRPCLIAQALGITREQPQNCRVV